MESLVGDPKESTIPGNVLFGNGLVIQFGGERYTNGGIINRALSNVRSGNFPRHLYPAECADFVRVLHREHRSVLNGVYDRFALASFEKAALEDFKTRYDALRRYSIGEIGFEDYFLLFELVYTKLRKTNPETFHVRGVLRRMFLDAVFDGGAIQLIHERFPTGFSEWLSEWDQVLTTNYDSNLDSAGAAGALHLHGSFDDVSDVYDPSSLRNQLSEDLLDGEEVDWSYPHLYSTCLLSYVSEMKSFSMTMASQANRGMEKLAAAYMDDPTTRARIDAFEGDDPLLRRMREAIKLKCADPDLQHAEQYPVERFREIAGDLTIIGLSPMNDNHLFREVVENPGISDITYFFYDEAEIPEVARRLEGKDVTFLDVRALWAELAAS